MKSTLDGDPLRDADLRAQCVVLLFGGHETTRRLVGNETYSLLSQHGALEDLQPNLTLLPNMLEAVLRYECPIQSIPRGVIEDMEFDGQTVAGGSSFVLMIGAGQRRSKQYADPDHFDISRKHIRHPGFEGDVHVCLGATLAVREGGLAVRMAPLPTVGERGEEIQRPTGLSRHWRQALRRSIAD